MQTERRVVRLQFKAWDHQSVPPYTLVVVDGRMLTHFITGLTLAEAANLFTLVGLPVTHGRVASVSDVGDTAVLGASWLSRRTEATWLGIAEGWAAVEESGQLDPLKHAIWEASAHIGGEMILKSLE